MKITRRNFLKGSLTTLFVAGFNLPIHAASKIKKNLVVISLRGGMDGLCAIPVKSDKNFEKMRPDLIIDEPKFPLPPINNILLVSFNKTPNIY